MLISNIYSLGLPKRKKKKKKIGKKKLVPKDVWLNKRAAELRTNATPAELRFKEWALNVFGEPFKFQHPIKMYGKGDFILDFYFYKQNICVEIDGAVHNEFYSRMRDEERDKRLMDDYGIYTIRIKNEYCYSSILDNIFYKKWNKAKRCLDEMVEEILSKLG